MADVNERKTPEEIKQRIVEALNDKPLNAQEISKIINSNWSTVKNYVEELIEEKKIKEIIFRGNSIYQRITEDTYFNIPITEEEREVFYFLFKNSKILFKKNGKDPTKTDINKATVQIIDEFNLSAPVVWYLYGKMALLKYDPQKEYSVKIDFEKEKQTKILSSLAKVVSELAKKKSSHEVREHQYTIYGQDFYQQKENLYFFLISSNLNQNRDRLKGYISDFVAKIPCETEFEKMCEIVSQFSITIRKMCFLKDLESCRKQILETFDSIWKMIAVYSFFESLSKYPRFKNKDEIVVMGLENATGVKMSMAQDSLLDLEEIYLSKIKEETEAPILKDSKENELVREILFEMATEGE